MIVSRIKNKLLFSVVAISLLMTCASMLAVSLVIRQQHLNQSNALLRKASNVIGDNLTERSSNLLAASRQLAAQKNIGSTIWYLAKYARADFDRETLFNTYQQLDRDISKIGRVAKASRTAIYDLDGHLISFVLFGPNGKRVGFVEHTPKAVFQVASLSKDEEISRKNLRTSNSVSGIGPEFRGQIPRQESVQYVVVDGLLSIESYVPIQDETFEPTTGNPVTKQVGLVVMTQSLDNSFVEQLSRITDTSINVFTSQGFTCGNLPAYKIPDRNGAHIGAETSSAGISFNEITVAGMGYYQCLLALNSNKVQIGTISALYSKEIVQSNTAEMIRTLGGIGFASMLLVFPFTWFFASSISKPLTILSSIFRDVASNEHARTLNEEFNKLKREVRRGDELGDLTQSFIAMNDAINQKIQQINEINASLEHKVLERTAALASSELELRALNDKNTNNLILLQNVIGRFPGVVFWKNTESMYLGCNKNFSDAAGLKSPDEIIGKSDCDLPWSESEATHYREFDRLVMESGEARLHIIESLHQADGKIAWFDTCKVPLLGSDGTVIGILGASFDISEIKKAEEEKLTLEQQLQQAQKLESLGVLSGGIAHDFNNILAIIIGNCGLAKIHTEKAYNYIPKIEIAAERAAALCRQMLAYAGKAQLIRTQVNMWLLVDEIVTLLKTTLPQNVAIHTDFATDIPNINVDASQIRQIVMNLIINASEAIGNVQGEINVSLARTIITTDSSDKDYNGKLIPPGKYVCLDVTDNGCGMDEQTKWRIFEPFYTTKFTGRGLGMSAVLGIIKSHNAAMQLISQLGHGSSFKVYLPVPVDEATGYENQCLSSPPGPWQGSGTILLVEDEDQVRQIAKELLIIFGFTVLEAVNGKEALELYQRSATEITLVMTDMGMPIMDGYELFYELKKLNPELPIIVSSGYGDAEVSSRIGSDNIAGLISKPFGSDHLQEVLKKALEVSQ